MVPKTTLLCVAASAEHHSSVDVMSMLQASSKIENLMEVDGAGTAGGGATAQVCIPSLKKYSHQKKSTNETTSWFIIENISKVIEK